jgi:phosphate transport system ATP-binding protein
MFGFGKPESTVLEIGEKPLPCCIRTINLSLSYGRKTAFRNVSLNLKPRSITALMGPSGCGKSSFLSALNRLTDLIPCCQVSGVIEIDGINISAREIDLLLLHRKVGMIFQKPNPFPFSIRKNITFPLREHGLKDKAQLEMRVEKALQDVGLWKEVKDRLDTPALALSGGQQQRLCIARALALDPEVLLMDEPCSALDPISSGIVEELITSLQDRYTLAVVTHNLAQARRIADYAALFWVREEAGCLVECGPVEQIFEDPQDEVTAAYIQGAKG